MRKFLQSHFQVDTMDEIPLDILVSNLEAARRVVKYPSDFPKAIPGYHQRLLDEYRIEKGLNCGNSG